ncbi:retrovirus-related pol polyprotein from transposon TNT 1-94 [Tanacetum coccineum]|uniref:Retrovirus-related pol polyprotein from transposon TNT 1-94 n=1 Tax=Tanacetum coccineum TaxID=301880 RepID=A0ABQ5AYK1_9ASTR
MITVSFEFVALAVVGKEAEWLKNLILEILLWSKTITPKSIRCDCATTLAKAYSQMYNRKSRHLGVRHSMIHELIMNELALRHPIPSRGNFGSEFNVKSLMIRAEAIFCLGYRDQRKQEGAAEDREILVLFQVSVEVRMKALLEQQGLAAALEELPAATIVSFGKKACALILYSGDRVLREITKETTAAGIWKKLETLYMTKYLANRLYLKKKLYTFQMHTGKSQSEHIDEFHKLVGDLAAIDTTISDKDQALLLLTSLPSSYDNFMETLIYGRDTMKLEDVVATLNSRELQKMKEAKGEGGEGFYVRGRFGQRDIEHGTYSTWSKSQGRSSRLGCYICQSEEHLKRDCPRYNHKKSQGCVRIEDHVFGSGADGHDTVNVMMAMNVE